jgi:hypothetical protein
MRKLLGCAALALLALVAVFVLASPGTAKTPSAQAAGFTSSCGVFDRPSGSNAASLPDQTAWNQDISKSPVASNSARIIKYIDAHGGSDLHADFASKPIYGIPFTVVSSSTPVVPVKFKAFGSESDKGDYRIPLSAPVEGGPKGNGDRHVVAYDKSACKLYELYRAFPKGDHWEADGGAIWDLSSNGLRKEGFTSADAAGLPIFPGLVRYDEFKSGSIDHAIRVTFESTRDAWIHPGSHCAGDTSNADAPPMGLRLRLKASVKTSGFGKQAKMVATALKRYGMIVADNGSNWFFQGGPNKGWDDDDLHDLSDLSGKSFEVIKSQAPTTTC